MLMRNAHLGEYARNSGEYFYVDDVLSFWESLKTSARLNGGRKRCPMASTEFAIEIQRMDTF